MSTKFALKVIQQGQTQKIHVVQPGAGLSGQRTTLKATDAARYQLADMITQQSPAKLQLKKVGNELHVALPGGDVSAPDIVIEDYFSVQNPSLWGNSGTGDWMTYDTSTLTETASSSGNSLWSTRGNASGANTVSLSKPPFDPASYVQTPMGLGVAVGGLALAAAALGGKGGGGSSSTTTSSDPQSIISSFAGNSGSTAPTAKNYSDLGVTLPTAIGVSGTNLNATEILNAMNAVVASKTAAEVDTVAKLNTLATNLKTAYEKILTEANGSAPAAPSSTPLTVDDFASVGIKVATTAGTLALLTNAIADLPASGVDTVAELKLLAATAKDIQILVATTDSVTFASMVSVANASTSSGTPPTLDQTDADLIKGINALCGGYAYATTANITAIKNLLIKQTDSTAVDTVAELKTLLSVQSLRDYAAASNGSGVTTPSLTIYKDAGVKALKALLDSTASVDMDDNSVTSAMGGTWLQALNAALDKQVMASTVSGADVVTQLQKMVNSYYRILSEADGDATKNTDVYPSVPDATSGSQAGKNDPSKDDYTNIGATVGNDATVDLLNDYVGRSDKAAVDTVDEINTIAKAAYNVMLLAGVTAASSGAPVEYSKTDSDAEWIAGLNTLLGTNTTNGVNKSNVAAVKGAIEGTKTLGTAGDGAEVDTIVEIKDLIKSAIALQVLKDYANATNGTGVTAPQLSTYKDASVSALANLAETDANASLDIDDVRVTNAMGGTWLQALNSALDKQLGDSTLTPAKLKALAASYYRILSEADNDTTKNTDVYPAVNDAPSGSQAGKNDPSKDDYTNIGVTVGNAASVDLLNDYVGRSDKTAVDTVDEINTIAKAAYNVMLLAGVTAASSGAPAEYSKTDSDAEWIAGLNTLLGTNTTNGVNRSNVAAVKDAIASTKPQTGTADGSKVDTIVEIKDLIKSAMALQVLKDYANATNGTGVTAPQLSTYKDAGIGAPSNLNDLGSSADIDAAGVVTAMGGNGNSWLQALNNALDKKVVTNDLTTAVGRDALATTLRAMVDSLYRILSEADNDVAKNTDVYPSVTDATSGSQAGKNDPSKDDYINIGVTVGNAASVDLLSDYVGRSAQSAVDTVDEINTIAKAAYNVMLLADVAPSTTAPVPTKYSESDNNAEWIVGLNLLLGTNSTTGVNTSNIVAVKKAIKDTDATNTTTGDGDGLKVDTVAEIQSLVSEVRLKAFADDAGTYFVTSASNTKNTTANPVPTLDDWARFGIKVNTNLSNDAVIAINEATFWKSTNPTNGLMALNSALDAQVAINFPTLQTVADSYGRILQEADGSRATNVDVSKVSKTPSISGPDVVLADLENVGVESSVLNDRGTGTLLASSIGTLVSTAVDTVQELRTLAGYAQNVMKQAAGGSTVTYTDNEWITALGGLGITGVTTSNITTIKAAIASTIDDGSAVDTWDELQAVVSLVRLNDYAALNTGYALPTLTDYQAILAANGKDYNNAKSSYLSSFNDAVNAQATVTSGAAVANMVSTYTTLLDLADGVRNSSSSVASADFAKIWGLSLNNTTGGAGVSSVEAKLMSNVIDGLTVDKIDTVSELSTISGVINKLVAIASASSSPSASISRAELASLGLTADGVAGHGFTDWNPNTGQFWVTDSEMNRFLGSGSVTSTTPGSLLGLGAANIETWQNLQDKLYQAVLNA